MLLSGTFLCIVCIRLKWVSSTQALNLWAHRWEEEKGIWRRSCKRTWRSLLVGCGGGLAHRARALLAGVRLPQGLVWELGALAAVGNLQWGTEECTCPLLVTFTYGFFPLGFLGCAPWLWSLLEFQESYFKPDIRFRSEIFTLRTRSSRC